MNWILVVVGAAWVLAMALVFGLLGMSSKQDRDRRDEEVEAAVRLLKQRWEGRG